MLHNKLQHARNCFLQLELEVGQINAALKANGYCVTMRTLTGMLQISKLIDSCFVVLTEIQPLNFRFFNTPVTEDASLYDLLFATACFTIEL
jgi:hypothetical protein